MPVTPSEILTLAIQRHRQPWNWTLHFCGLAGFALSLMLHSYLLFAASLIIFGAGFFELGLPPVKENRWLRFVHEAVEWEKNWIAAPWNWQKIWRFGVFLMFAVLFIWACWEQEPVAIALFSGFAYLAKVVRENKEGGIDP